MPRHHWLIESNYTHMTARMHTTPTHAKGMIWYDQMNMCSTRRRRKWSGHAPLLSMHSVWTGRGGRERGRERKWGRKRASGCFHKRYQWVLTTTNSSSVTLSTAYYFTHSIVLNNIWKAAYITSSMLISHEMSNMSITPAASLCMSLIWSLPLANATPISNSRLANAWRSKQYC